MAEPVEFKVHGLKELQEALTQLPAELVSRKGGPVKTALMAAALPVMRTAQNTVPDRDSITNSGRLMNSIKRKRVKDTGGGKENSEAVIVYVRKGRKRDDATGAFYAPFVEFGANNLSATNWFSNSLEHNSEESLRIFRKRLASAIERIAKKINAQNAAKVAAKVKQFQ